MSSSSTGVLVVGGGPAGLTAALAAARAGHQVELIEAGTMLGGMAASIWVGGQRVDLGSHRLHPSAPAPVRRLLDELLGSDLQVRQRHGAIRVRGTWVGFPFGAAELVRTLPLSFTARAGIDVVTRPLRRARRDSYAEVVRVGLGPTALRDFHGPMARKLWGIDPDRLSGELARRRIPVRSPAKLAARLMRTSRPAGRTFLYPRHGYGQFVERLADQAAAAGVALSTGVRPVEARPGAAPEVRLDDGRVVSAGRVLWTAPLEALADAVGGGPDRGCASSLHRGLALVYLVVPRPRYRPIDAHYVPDVDVAFSRLSEPKNYRDGPDPPDVTVLCAEVPCTRGDELWESSIQQLRDIVLDGVARCGLPVPPVADVVVHRLPQVYPVITVDEPRRRDALLRWADDLDGVAVLGRQGLVVGDNLHHVIDMALSAAACLGRDDAWDAGRWRAERARFDTFVVDD